ncbi:MAG TPA: DUF2231 domain-containing protein [Gammaproteobacteria bacterium]|nr:DUF2231 domain-containing protein [Gammaproteobacteria bacterium]
MIDIAHIHPMLVHFPIVLLLIAVAIDFVVLLKKGDLAAKDCLPTSGLAALVLAALAAIAAASFGDIALDKAVELGFNKAALEQHEELGLTTLWILLGLALWQMFARWRGMQLKATMGWVFFAVSLAGTAVLLTAAYFGGELVYSLGVNVAPVHP